MITYLDKFLNNRKLLSIFFFVIISNLHDRLAHQKHRVNRIVRFEFKS